MINVQFIRHTCIFKYRIYSIWGLIKFLDFESGRLFEAGAYSGLGASFQLV